jgi:hypothetical protein
MSFFEDASLVLIPSAYKDQKVYSVKPTDGTGDLTFSRASDATRVQSDGLIEKVRTNFKIQSEALTTAAGGLSFTDITTITANTTETLDPFGTNKAEKFDGTIGQVADTYNSISTFVPNTSSIYAKAGTATSFDLRMSGGFSAAANAVFNLSNGTVTSSGGGELISSKIEFVGNGWYRCSISYNFTNTPTNRIALTANGNVYFFGWQLEATDFGPTDYIATTTAAVSVGITADIPRLDYTGGGCPSLLLEPQRTNLVLYSEQFDNAAWTKVGATITANAAVSPDGFTNSDKLIASAAPLTTHFMAAVVSKAASNIAYTFSCYAKNVEGLNLRLLLDDSATAGSPAGQGANLDVNLTTGAEIAPATTFGAGFSNVSGRVDLAGNGFYRIQLTVTSNTATSIRAAFNLLSGTTSVFTGNGTDGVLIYGAQLEVGSYATSYIPTLGASVTRVADSASKTSASALIGQTEGTIFWEFQLETPAATGHEDILNIDNGSFGSTIYLIKTAVGGILAEIYNAGLQASFSISSRPAGTYKCALGYATNNSAFFINGVQVGTTDTSCSIPATSRIQLGNGLLGPSTNLTKQLLLFPTRLTNAQLAELTA